MNCPFTVLLKVKGDECKTMTPQNDVTQTLDRNKSALYKPPQDAVMLQDFWNMRKNEFLTQSITLGSFVRWWSREENELDLQCGLTWWNEQPDPSPVSPVNIHDLCNASCWLLRWELRWLCACRLTMSARCGVIQTKGLLVWRDHASSIKDGSCPLKWMALFRGRKGL